MVILFAGNLLEATIHPKTLNGIFTLLLVTRPFLLKGASWALVTQKLCNTITRQLNTRPRKRIDVKTTQEFINEYLPI